MTSARDEILARVAEAVGREGIDPKTEARLTERLHHPPVQLRPQWDDDPVERFVSKLRAVAATVDAVNTAADVAKSIASFLRENDLPPACFNGTSTRRQLIQRGNIQITVHRKCQGSGNGRGRHHQ